MVGGRRGRVWFVGFSKVYLWIDFDCSFSRGSRRFQEVFEWVEISRISFGTIELSKIVVLFV